MCIRDSLVTRWRHLYLYQIWSQDAATCISPKLERLLKLWSQYPGSVVPLAMFYIIHCDVLDLRYMRTYLWSDLSLPSASDILRYAERVKYMAERVRYMVLPINLRYIYKRVPPLVLTFLFVSWCSSQIQYYTIWSRCYAWGNKSTPYAAKYEKKKKPATDIQQTAAKMMIKIIVVTMLLKIFIKLI